MNVLRNPSPMIITSFRTPRRFLKQTFCLVLAGVFALSGCSLAPKYHRPELTMPQQWKAPQDSDVWKTAEPKDHLPRGHWWAIFNDDELNRLEDMALVNNQSLKSAVASVMQARAVARVVSSVSYPRVGLDPSARRTWESDGGSIFTEAQSSDDFILPVNLSYESDFWDFWGRNKSLSAEGWAEASAEQAAYQTVLLTLTSNVAYNYFQMRTVDKEIVILDQTIELRRNAVDLVSKRVDAGVGKELDLNRAKTELAQALTSRVDAQRRRGEFENVLAVLCGQAAPDFSLETGSLNGFVPTVPVSVPSTLLERRPDVAQAERLVQAANARIGTAKAAYYPQISLEASASLENTKVSNLFKTTSLAWALGPDVRWDILDFGKNKARVAAAKADYERTVADYRQSVLQAFADVETYLSNVRLRERQAASQDDVVSAARTTADISIARYKEGLTSFLEVVDAERSRLDAELEAARVLNQRLIASVQLVKALGGGWDEAVQE